MSFLQWLEFTKLADWVATSTWGYPVLLSAHSVGMAVIVGILFIINMRIVGLFPHISLTQLRNMLRLAWFGFVINLGSGLCLFTVQATDFINNIAFLVKIGAIFLAIINAALLQNSLKNHAQQWDSGASISSKTKVLSITSLVLWSTAIIAGRLIAYIEVGV